MYRTCPNVFHLHQKFLFILRQKSSEQIRELTCVKNNSKANFRVIIKFESANLNVKVCKWRELT
jgi:hypothetical protein